MNTKKFFIKQPSAWFPVILSLIVLFMMLISFTMFGIPHRQADEGTAAHLFQIWLVIEVLLIAFFAIKWIPQKPKQGFIISAMQIVAALAACTPVFILNL